MLTIHIIAVVHGHARLRSIILTTLSTLVYLRGVIVLDGHHELVDLLKYDLVIN